MRNRTILPGSDKGEEAEHPSLAGYSEAERLLREGIDIVSGGFPCQDISTAGKGAGIQYDKSTGEAFTRSGLFGQIVRTIRLVRPGRAVLENVAALLSRGMGEVLGELACIRYNTEWDCISAADVGAPHLRARVWIICRDSERELANTDKGGLSHGYSKINSAKSREYALSEFGSSSKNVADTNSKRLSRPTWAGFGSIQGTPATFEGGELGGGASTARGNWEIEPDVGRVADGVSFRMDRVQGLGNAIIPQISEIIGQKISEGEN